jgi:hypothetical protein
MRKLLWIGCMIMTSLAQAQGVTFYESSLSQGYVFNYDTKKYELKEELWEKTRFAYTREWVAIEFEPDEIYKVWWAFYNEPIDGLKCYYIEGDAWKICTNTRDNQMWFYKDNRDGYFEKLWVISKIEKVKQK